MADDDAPSLAFDVEGFEHVLTATGLIEEVVKDVDPRCYKGRGHFN